MQGGKDGSTMLKRSEWRTWVATGKFFTLIMIVIFV